MMKGKPLVSAWSILAFSVVFVLYIFTGIGILIGVVRSAGNMIGLCLFCTCSVTIFRTCCLIFHNILILSIAIGFPVYYVHKMGYHTGKWIGLLFFSSMLYCKIGYWVNVYDREVLE